MVIYAKHKQTHVLNCLILPAASNKNATTYFKMLDSVIRFTPLVSVVITSYNRLHSITKTLDSIINQTYQNIEIVVADAASTDGTVEYFRDQFPAKVKNRRFIFNTQKDSGPSEGRNIGLTLSSGDYIVFFDSDDIMMPNRIELQVLSLDGGKYSASCCGFKSLQKEFEFTPPNDKSSAINKFLRRKNHIRIGTQAWMLSRKYLLEIKGYDEDILHLEDLDLVLRYLQVNQDLAYVYQPLTLWNESNDSDRLSNSHVRQVSIKTIAGIKRFYSNMLDCLFGGRQKIHPSNILFCINNLAGVIVNLIANGHEQYGCELRLFFYKKLNKKKIFLRLFIMFRLFLKTGKSVFR